MSQVSSEQESEEGLDSFDAGPVHGPSEIGLTTRFDLATIKAAKRQEDERRPVLTIIAGAQVGRPIPIDQESLMLGRDSLCDVVLVGRGLSRRHMDLRRTPAGNLVVTDPGSTNGVFVNGERIERHVLANGDLVQLGPQTVFRFSYELTTEIELRARQYEESIRDDLTGAYNRRFFTETLEHEIAYGLRHGEAMSVVLFDVDHFKLVNDNFGHRAGDEVIRRLAEQVSDHLRTEDMLSRYGGEEFAVILRGLDEQQAFGAAERIRRLVESIDFDTGTSTVKVTVSLGVSTLCASDECTQPVDLVEEADRYLYQAKCGGRNRTAGRWQRLAF